LCGFFSGGGYQGEMSANDNELLRQYLNDRSESAFGELVERHLGLVFSAALRQVDGDRQAAEDVTQAVFTNLARRSARLLHHPTLSGWLYTTTRYLATNTRRAALRRRAHEQSAQIMNDLYPPDGPEQDWTALRPILDEAMHDLNPADRDAVLWRYFEKHPFSNIGLRLGLNENAARMRVERALDKLRLALAKRGVTSSAAALAGLVSVQAVASVPAGLAGRICRASLAAAGAGGLLAWITILLATSKAKVALGLAALAAIVALTLGNWPPGADSAPVAAARGEDSSSPSSPSIEPNIISTVDDALTNPASLAANEPAKLRLKLVAADTSEPVKGADVRYYWSVGADSSSKHILSDDQGIVELTRLEHATRIEFLTGVEGFADTMLSIRPERGEVIPAEYTLRLARAVRVGGLVLDPNGVPVSGATVEGSYPTDSLWESQRETHIAEFKATTDASGKWESRRVAPELIRSLRLHARHPRHGPSEPVEVSSDPDLDRQLREGTLTFHLAAATGIRGLVLDPENNPVPGAKVLLGQLYSSDSKRATTAIDGSFEFAGVPPGKRLLTGNAEGFATTTVQLDLHADSDPVLLTLTRGKPLAVRVVDSSGQPVAQASVWGSAHRRVTQTLSETIPELRLDGKTDTAGRVVFAHVPEADIIVGVSAEGYMEMCGVQIRPGGTELVIRLAPELVVTGTVRDGVSGKAIPRFKILTGRPEPGGPYWSTIGRFQFSFEGGSFRHAYHEAVVCDGTNAGYLLKFEADGYAPYISRFISPDERLAQLDIRLEPALTRQFLVLNPNQSPAAWADVGFPALARGNTLALVPGGFSRRFTRTDDALQRADDQGRLKCVDPGHARIVVAAPAGYAEVDGSNLPDAIIRLQPWGRVEGILPRSEPPAANREVQFLYHTGSTPNGIIADFFSAYRTKPDPTGRFVLPQVPPGHHRIVELIPGPDVDAQVQSWGYGRSAEIDVRAGETTEATLQPVVKEN
jgi:RNA polymerase sigma factor (sigma-70 family)